MYVATECNGLQRRAARFSFLSWLQVVSERFFGYSSYDTEEEVSRNSAPTSHPVSQCAMLRYHRPAAGRAGEDRRARLLARSPFCNSADQLGRDRRGDQGHAHR
jgi:hypothetical protein